MDSMIKAVSAAIIGCVFALMLKKNNGETALLISLAAAIVIFGCAFQYIDVIRSFWNELTSTSSAINKFAEPLLKVVGISMVTKVASELCRDSGEGALAAKLEFCGSAACIAVSVPLMSAVLTLLGELV